MDPNKLFVVSRITRAGIAENLDLDPNDPRLTDELCEKYAHELGNVHGTDEDELCEEMAENFRETHNLS